MLLLKNATYINPETFEFCKTDIWVEEGVDGNIYFKKPENPTGNITTLYCDDLYVTKSFANAHHHIYSALALGMPQPKTSPKNFHEVLQYVWWKLDYALDEKMIRSSALATALAAAKSGCSFIIDHHSSPSYINGSLNIIADALNEVGIGHLLAYEITDRNGILKTKEAFDETSEYLKNNQGLVGMHAGFTLDNNTIEKAVEIASDFNTGLHVHLAEDKIDQSLSEKKYGKSVVERYNDLGVFNLKSNIFVHAIHLNENERNIIRKSNSYIAINYDSNLNNKVGIFNSKGLGNNIMLGTDGMHSKMIEASKTAWFTGMNHDNITLGEVYNRLRKVHKYLNSNNFKGDKGNNLVIFDYNPPTPFNNQNFLGHFFYGMSSSNVKHLISQGKLIIENGKHAFLNEEEIIAEAKENATRLWKTFNS